MVFTDVTGSTDLGERLDPETMRAVITRYFDAMQTVIERHGGTVEKFIGDAVMAVFGVPQVHEDDALRAVRAAVDMRGALAALNESLHAERGVTIATRTGVHTGEVMAGDASSRERFVSGDTVNVAARLEQAAAPGETLLGATTYQLVRDAVEVEPVEPLTLKGKSAPVEAYRLVAVRADATGHERHMDAPMVGRARQLRMVRDSFEAAVEDRTCTMFTVLGSPGVGKTRLVEEFLAGVRDDASIHRGRCLSYGEGITFWPVDEIVRSICGLEADDDAAISETLRGRLAGADEADAVATAVEGLLGLGLERVDLQDGFWAVRRLLEHAARERPVVVLFDDIHWAEPALLDLIEHLADWSREAPVLLLCTARPELLDMRPNWGGGKSNATTTLLEPLSAEEAGLLLDNLLGSELPLEARERIVAGAEGNPLFVEEMLGMLVDRGLLVAVDGRWVVQGEIGDVAVPDSIHALISARLDRLAPEERIVIERGAVEGKLFHVGGVAALAPELKGSVRAQLMTLVRKELIRPDRADFAGDEAFRFRHLLIRDTAYGSLPKQTRADLHARFGDWLAAHAVRAGGMDAIVAHHFDQAQRYLVELGGNEARAAELGGLAAERYAVAAEAAVEHGDDRGALALFERAAALLPLDDPDSLEVRVGLGRTLIRLGRFDEAEAILRDVEHTASDAGHRLIELHAAAGRLALKDAVETDWSDSRFIGESERIEAGLRELGDRVGAVRAVLLRVNWITRAKGENLARSAAAEAAEIGDRSLEWEAVLWFHSVGLWGMRPADELERSLRESLARPIPNRHIEGSLRAELGSVLAMLGRFDEGSTEVDRGLAICHELGLAREIQQRGFFRGVLLEGLRGDLETALETIERSVDGLGAIGEQNRRSSLAGAGAWLSARLGDVANAERLLQIAMDTATPDDDDTHALASQARSVVASGRGQHDEAITQASDAIRLHRKRATWVEGDGLVTLADALSAAGDPAGGRSALEEALLVFETKGVVPKIDETRNRLGKLLD